jgi:hypothetical protein
MPEGGNVEEPSDLLNARGYWGLIALRPFINSDLPLNGTVEGVPLSDRFTLCLAWTPRNANTCPALADLIATLKTEMSVE